MKILKNIDLKRIINVIYDVVGGYMILAMMVLVSMM